jgi:hypothetical protein
MAMDTLKSASFGTLFQITFVVAATFQVAAAVLGLLFAVLAPGGFNLNGRPAQSIGEAITVVLIMIVAGMLLNAAISAGGSGLWLLIRRVLFKKPSPASVF